jgi:hypothetical protein
MLKILCPTSEIIYLKISSLRIENASRLGLVRKNEISVDFFDSFEPKKPSIGFCKGQKGFFFYQTSGTKANNITEQNCFKHSLGGNSF